MPDPATVTSQIAAITASIPDYWRDDQAFAEASQAWGGGHNEHGVFEHGQDELVATCKNAEARVTVAESPNGLFSYGLHYQGSMNGFGFAPSIWGEAYGSRAEAMHAALEELLVQLETERPTGKAAAEEIDRIKQQLVRRLQPQQGDLFTQALTTAPAGANLAEMMEEGMADEQTEKTPEVTPAAGEDLAKQDAEAPAEKAIPVKKPRKPRAPRKKKVAETAAAETPAASKPTAGAQAEPVTQAAVQHETPAEPASHVQQHTNGHSNGHVSALNREPIRRKSGRVAVDINLAGGNFTWERVFTPPTETHGGHIVFRFKEDATPEQLALLDRQGFRYLEDRKEAFRPNDQQGREAADRTAWYLKQMERQHKAAASRG